MSITDFNKGYELDYDLKNVVTWKKGRDMVDGKSYMIVTLGYHDSKFGDSVFIVVRDGKFDIGVNLPKWCKETIEEIKKNADAVEEIKSGKAYVKFTGYTTKAGYKTVGLKFERSELPY